MVTSRLSHLTNLLILIIAWNYHSCWAQHSANTPDCLHTLSNGHDPRVEREHVDTANTWTFVDDVSVTSHGVLSKVKLFSKASDRLFQVGIYRPNPAGVECEYTLVKKYRFERDDIQEGYLELDVPSDEWMLVSPGDHIGFTWYGRGVVAFSYAQTQHYCEQKPSQREGETKVLNREHAGRIYSFAAEYKVYTSSLNFGYSGLGLPAIANSHLSPYTYISPMEFLEHGMVSNIQLNVQLAPSLMTVTLCSNKARHLRCKDGLTVGVLSAYYGAIAECDADMDLQPNALVCPKDNALEIIRESCKDRSSCTVKASHRTMGDLVDCPHDVEEVLQVTYTCQDSDADNLVDSGAALFVEKLDTNDVTAVKPNAGFIYLQLQSGLAWSDFSNISSQSVGSPRECGLSCDLLLDCTCFNYQSIGETGICVFLKECTEQNGPSDTVSGYSKTGDLLVAVYEYQGPASSESKSNSKSKSKSKSHSGSHGDRGEKCTLQIQEVYLVKNIIPGQHQIEFGLNRILLVQEGYRVGFTSLTATVQGLQLSQELVEAEPMYCYRENLPTRSKYHYYQGRDGVGYDMAVEYRGAECNRTNADDNYFGSVAELPIVIDNIFGTGNDVPIFDDTDQSCEDRKSAGYCSRNKNKGWCLDEKKQTTMLYHCKKSCDLCGVECDQPGFMINSEKLCVDIDECGRNDMYRCGRDALCSNIPGSYTCECPPEKPLGDPYKLCLAKCGEGYELVGRRCRKINPCTSGLHKCPEEARCRLTATDYRCICPRGMADIIDQDTQNHQCMKELTCRASGDPHFYSFDGETIDFMGTCVYTLVSTECPAHITPLPRDMLPFTVDVKNQHRHGNTRVSYLQYIEVEIGGDSIRLDQGRVVLINGEAVQLPYIPENATYTVQHEGNNVMFSSKFGLRIVWSGATNVYVYMNDKYGGHVCGLCGNADGERHNDMVPQEGGPSLKSDADLGDSWRVIHKGGETCVPSTDEIPECSAEQDARFDAMCGLIRSSPFSKCHDQVEPEEFIKECKFDLCAEFEGVPTAGLEEHLLETLCDYYKEYADLCLFKNVIVEWDKDNICPHHPECQLNSHYLHSVSCSPSCADPYGLATCFDQPIGGCQCLPGFLQDGESPMMCVQPDECGCTFEEEYHSIGQTWVNADCSMKYKCVAHHSIEMWQIACDEEVAVCGHTVPVLGLRIHKACYCGNQKPESGEIHLCDEPVSAPKPVPDDSIDINLPVIETQSPEIVVDPSIVDPLPPPFPGFSNDDVVIPGTDTGIVIDHSCEDRKSAGYCSRNKNKGWCLDEKKQTTMLYLCKKSCDLCGVECDQLGFMINSQKLCVDIDECGRNDMYRCGRDALCSNIPGSYMCECPPEKPLGDPYKLCLAKCEEGYELVGRRCKRINPCTSGLHKCPEKARCRLTATDYRCICPRGMADVIDEDTQAHQCIKELTCRASGDPHFYSFDGETIDFMGTCVYTLVSTECPDHIAPLPRDMLPFTVDVKNQHRHGNTRVSYLQYIEVEIGGDSIRLDQGRLVLINGEAVQLPYIPENAPYTVQHEGNNVMFSSKFGLRIVWSGATNVYVYMNDKYGGHVCGLCGNADGERHNDMVPQEGGPSLNSDADLGDSWRVLHKGGETCVPSTDDIPECSAEQDARFDAMCGLVRSSPFSKCHDQVDPEEFIDECKFDLCAEFDGVPPTGLEPQLKETLCDYYKEYADLCLFKNIVVEWDKEHICPHHPECQLNSHYLHSVSCSPSCADPYGLATCFDQPIGGCQCLPGFLQDGETPMTCVQPHECGCTFEEEYHSIGHTWVNADCSVKYECVAHRSIEMWQIACDEEAAVCGHTVPVLDLRTHRGCYCRNQKPESGEVHLCDEPVSSPRPVPDDTIDTDLPVMETQSPEIVVDPPVVDPLPPPFPGFSNDDVVIPGTDTGIVIDHSCEDRKSAGYCSRNKNKGWCLDEKKQTTMLYHCRKSCDLCGVECDQPGFMINSEKLCVDIDECGRNDMYRCGREALCSNTPGSYMCECPPEKPLGDPKKRCLAQCGQGFELVGTRCKRINPCTSGRHTCPEEAVCRLTKTSYRCRCPGGLTDVVDVTTQTHKCVREFSCQARGDPHFYTFDGIRIDFQGTCEYTLASTDCPAHILPMPQGLPGFSVEVKNQHKHGNTRVSFLQYVVVRTGGDSIRLDQGGIVFVNGEQVELPYFPEGSTYTVQHEADSVVLTTTSTGLRVIWSGTTSAYVYIDEQYKGHVCGLCGNADDIPENDMVPRQGGPPLKSEAEVGDSWKVAEQGEDECSETIEDLPECSAEESRRFSAECGLLNDAPFSECRAVVPAQDFNEDCQFDLCAEYQGTADVSQLAELEATLCEVYKAYADLCLSRGVLVEWDKDRICPYNPACPANSHYQHSVSCSPSCTDPEGLMTCVDQPIGGCQCMPGFLQDGVSPLKCVQPHECGCLYEEKYYSIGHSWVNADCSMKYECVAHHSIEMWQIVCDEEAAVCGHTIPVLDLRTHKACYCRNQKPESGEIHLCDEAVSTPVTGPDDTVDEENPGDGTGNESPEVDPLPPPFHGFPPSNDDIVPGVGDIPPESDGPTTTVDKNESPEVDQLPPLFPGFPPSNDDTIPGAGDIPPESDKPTTTLDKTIHNMFEWNKFPEVDPLNPFPGFPPSQDDTIPGAGEDDASEEDIPATTLDQNDNPPLFPGFGPPANDDTVPGGGGEVITTTTLAQNENPPDIPGLPFPGFPFPGGPANDDAIPVGGGPVVETTTLRELDDGIPVRSTTSSAVFIQDPVWDYNTGITPPKLNESEDNSYFQLSPEPTPQLKPRPLGMQSCVIQTEYLSASSEVAGGEAYRARPLSCNSKDTPSGWQPVEEDTNSYLQIDLGSEVPVHGVGTLGHYNQTCWVEKYKVYVSNSGEEESFTALKDRDTGEDRIFGGNSDQNTWRHHCFHRYYGHPILARYVRLVPLEQSQCKALRVELYGFRKSDDDQLVKALESDAWTKNTTGCQCYYDPTSFECACCEGGGCQCPNSNRHQCVQCGYSINCGIPEQNDDQNQLDPWTKTPSGCPCPSDLSDTSCACCQKYSCQCGKLQPNQCVVCGHPEQCGSKPEIFGPPPVCVPKVCPAVTTPAVMQP